jgi:hypothetical protein
LCWSQETMEELMEELAVERKKDWVKIPGRTNDHCA